MFPPEEIAAAKAREAQREQDLAQMLARRVVTELRDYHDVAAAATLDAPATVGVELLDGSSFVVEVTPAH